MKTTFKLMLSSVGVCASLLTGCVQTSSAPSTKIAIDTPQKSPNIDRLQSLSPVQMVAIPTGKSSFMFRDAQGRNIKVFSYKGESFAPSSEIWFTMHGLGREAEKTRDEWLRAADLNGLLILAPEFSEANFPTSSDYTTGNIGNKDTGYDLSKSNYATIEAMFDSAVAATGGMQKVYGIFGHSAGGQFIQKMMMLYPTVRADFAIAANPGWYVMPSCSEIPNVAAAYPYSLANGPYAAADCPAALTRAMSRKVLIMLGNDDRDPAHPQLSKTPGAMLQGSNRFSRGDFFIGQMQQIADARKIVHNWKVQVVPGVGHNGSEMAQSALFVLYRPARGRR